MKIYRIERIQDLFAVPLEKRAKCLKEIEHGLALVELACGSRAAEELKAVEWKDDGDDLSELIGADGKAICTMEVKPA
jgi:hypothetical protein